MIPAAFDYHSVDTVPEAIELLDRYGEDAKLLAGGQSLLAVLKLRLAKFGVLIDLGRIKSLREIAAVDGRVMIGAMATHNQLGTTALTEGAFRAFRDAASEIGDPLVRNRGTFGGSLAQADPAGDWPALALAFGATIHATNAKGPRRIAADRFFTNLFTTALEQGDVLTHIEFPRLEADASSAYVKIPHPASGFAVAAAAVVLTLDDGGTCRQARIALTGVAPTAFRAREAEAMIAGKRMDAALIRVVADQIAETTEALTDNYASAEYRQNLAGVVTRRAINLALKRSRH
jgi:aerobic carbon-monoxide dehydrogenase medium subunit